MAPFEQWRQDFIQTFLQRDLPQMGASIAADTLLVQRLEPFLANVGKSLVQSPTVCVRDNGLVHALRNVTSLSDLQGHTIVGASWEGFVVEQVRAHRR